MLFGAPFLRYVTLAIAVTSMTFAAPTSIKRADGSVVMTAPNIIPSIWQQLGAASDPSPYTFTMSLASGDMAGLSTKMQEIATTGGAWLTDDELAAYAKPSADTTAAVTQYLLSQGLTTSALSFSKYGDQVTVTSTVGQTAKMFSAQFTNFNFNGLQVARTKGYTIPTAISSHVEDIFPLANFAQVKYNTAVIQKAGPFDNTTVVSERAMMTEEGMFSSELDKRATPSSCSTSKVTPACLKDYYGTTSYSRSTGSATKVDVSVMGYIDQYVSQTDLTNFLTTYSSSASGYQIPIVLRDGATNDASNAGIEAMLDVETVVSEIYPLTANFVAEGNSQTQGDIFLLTFNDFVNNYSTTNRPKVITISYGSDEDQFTSAQANSMCTAAQKLTALGTTIVVSSGDDGVAGQDDTCPPFTPTYPGGCQYILSVGATQSFSPEVMVDTTLAGFYSGAGASNIFTTPSYQTSQVAAYTSAIGTMSGDYNTKGRFFPDIAAQGSQFIVIAGGQSQIVGGTSASAPLTASLVAMVNDQRAKAGKGTIGWANPTLYSYGVLNDITSGGSYACNSGTTLGFPARSGYDGSSGNGSPLFAKLSAALG
ncbi:hypothetical protein CBS101457_002082 [Exobasidium rhododendri]|nr:hypothetical protein CBS101457_002082 [Exobasidium rhododendri]